MRRALLLAYLMACSGEVQGVVPPNPDAGSTQPDGGSTNPDAGSTNPDAGSTNPDAGSTNPDAGSTNPDAGSTNPDAGSNQPPVVSAGPDKAITLPATSVTFLGTATDADGTITTLLWTQRSGPSTATLSGQSTASLTASALVAGTYVFRLTATDNDNASAFDEAQVVVAPAGVLTPITVTPIPASDPDLVAPGRAAEIWNGVVPGVIQIPVAGQTAQALNFYYRFNWADLEGAQGAYDFTKFDQQIHYAIDNGMSFSFGIMPVCDGCSASTVDGGGLAMPVYLHTAMQAEAVPDWLYGDDSIWVPNWNSPTYLSRWEALLNAVANHIATGTYQGAAYSNVIYYVDVRGYGNYGEWHTYPWTNSTPSGAVATVATFKRIIDSHITAFPHFPLVALIAGFDGSGTPPEVTSYLLTASNAWGTLGWRRDNWGDPGYTDILEDNTGSYGGVVFKTLIMARWQTSPIVGEPLADSTSVSQGGNCDYWELPAQVARYHATSFGNGNIANPALACAQTNVRAASKASGYRLVIASGSFTATVGASRVLSVQLAWQNIGLAPPYQSWDIDLELRTAGGTTAWSGKSTLGLKGFLPASAPQSVQDDFMLPAGVAAGTYSLVVVVKDPNGYRAPLPLAISGRQSDGSYPLGMLTVQ